MELVVYGNRLPRAPNWCTQRLDDELLAAALSVGDGLGVDIEWGTNAVGHLAYFQLRPLTRPIRESMESAVVHATDGSTLHGVPAAPGRSGGMVSTAGSANSQTILMLRDGSVADMESLTCSAGAILASGGMLSHAAIVCRELGIPCVAGTRRMLPEGTSVEVDGYKGTVEVRALPRA